MPRIVNLFILILLSLIVVSAQNVHRRFEYKYSFKGPYLAQKNNQVPFWSYAGSAIASEESFRITPSLRSQKGQAWGKNPTSFPWWEVEMIFRVNGRGRIGADGLALWFTATQGIEGPVFGNSDKWVGLGLFFDSFDNDNKRNNPYVMGMVNDGNIAYDHENDGASQQLGGCLRDFRNKPFPIRAKIEYYHNVLTVRMQQLEFDYSPIAPDENPNDVFKARYYESGPDFPCQRHSFLERFSASAPSPRSSQSEDSKEEKLGWSLLDGALEFLGGGQRKLLLFEGDSDYVDLDHLDEKGEVILSTPSPSPVKKKHNAPKRRKRRNQGAPNRRVRGKSTKKKRRADSSPKAVFIHNGMTDNEKDYELCFRAENIVLPSSGYFGLTAATGGLADDHDVLKFLVHSLRSPEEMAQHRLNTEEETRYQKEFEDYQEKTKKAREEYIAAHPDAGRREDDQYETSEQRELRQIFQGQAQIYEIIRHLNKKMDDLLISPGISMALAPGGQPDMVAQPDPAGGATGGISRNEVAMLMSHQKELVQNMREIKSLRVDDAIACAVGPTEVTAFKWGRAFLSAALDIQTKAGAILAKGQGSVQPVGVGGGGYDMHVTLKELNEGLNIVKRDVGAVHQRMGAGGGATGCPPQPSCVSTTLFVVLMVLQVVCFLGYFMFRDSREARAKKFY